jgi:hypothetical protein
MDGQRVESLKQRKEGNELCERWLWPKLDSIQFSREADMLTKQAHPNVVPIYTKGRDEACREIG